MYNKFVSKVITEILKENSVNSDIIENLNLIN